MDNYIKLCAEIAYNDSLMESYFEEENLLEADNKGGFKEKIKKFFNTIKIFIKNLFDKVSSFITDAIEKVKEKINNKKKSKQESVSLYSDLMEMVINEDSSYGTDIMKFYVATKEDIADCEKTARNMYHQSITKINGLEKEYLEKVKNEDNSNSIDMIRRDLEQKLKRIEDDFKLAQYTPDNIDKAAQSIGNHKFENDSISSNILNVLIAGLEKNKKDLQFEMKLVEDNEKIFDNMYKSAWENDPGDDDNSFIMERCTLSSKKICQVYYSSLSKYKGSYMKLISTLVRFV